MLVILFSWFVFDEFASATAPQVAGILLMAMSIYLFTLGEKEVSTSGASGQQTLGAGGEAGKPSGEVFTRGAVNLAMATIVTAAIALLAKYAVGTTQRVDTWLFIFFSNLASSVVACVLVCVRLGTDKRNEQVGASEQPSLERSVLRRSLMWGLALGVVNLGSYWCLLTALSLGSASVIIPIYSMYIIIPMVLASIIDGTKLTDRLTVGILLAVLAVTILRS